MAKLSKTNELLTAILGQLEALDVGQDELVLSVREEVALREKMLARAEERDAQMSKAATIAIQKAQEAEKYQDEIPLNYTPVNEQIEEHLRQINNLIGQGGYNGVNLGTLRRLRSKGFISRSVSQWL